MFTGIIRERGRVAELVERNGALHLTIDAPKTAAGLAVGDSVSVNGCCLTATAVSDADFAVTVVPESLSRTTLGGLEAGADVNLEAALRAGEALGGHYVQGHVDGTGRIADIADEGDGARVRLDASPEILRYCVEKGSIAVDGVSLTITALDDSWFEVALVPHTLEVTTLGDIQPGDEVNLEVDVLAKYVEKLLHTDTISAR